VGLGDGSSGLGEGLGSIVGLGAGGSVIV
jgi:hypothetical protein